MLYAVSSEFIVVFDGREGQVNIQRIASVRSRRSLTRFKRNHQIHPGSWTLDLKLVNEILSEYLTQELLKFIIYTDRAVRASCREDGKKKMISDS